MSHDPTANEELADVDPIARGYILNGSTGEDSLRGEDIERLDAWRRNRQFFRQRNEYGPTLPGLGGRVPWVLIAAIAAIAVIMILAGGVR